MDFVIQWLWYLLAFVAGSAVARVIANILNKRAGTEAVPADSSGAGTGGQR
ncbi:hypothetical protein H7H82_09825 [Mycobacterium heidelbergense]|uniref:channel accessory protein ArfB n=1 Tax=Mycobacterium heidelbergense TaxID=53376 RepID=UPI00138BC13E|nr:hypothetical protein [Mycobacterium heidelbergense]MCV7050891.1 hypothetical protein [Mycobacterium heidelbergense]BBZ51157.1 hypothetical protein MHEI_28740 [Mycobacterium heidelbergense]